MTEETLNVQTLNLEEGISETSATVSLETLPKTIIVSKARKSFFSRLPKWIRDVSRFLPTALILFSLTLLLVNLFLYYVLGWSSYQSFYEEEVANQTLQRFSYEEETVNLTLKILE